MATSKIVSLIGKRAAAEPESAFLSLIDRDIESNAERIKPIPSSLFDRFAALKQRMQHTLDQEVQEG
ncbi:hypothetical protein [Dyella sp.]|uniref:hypothetical protein n=1 Tax=Dyella sp. TaxID=1869338 RepID=UPI003F7D7923